MKKGFTLVEMMAVIIILAIVATITFPIVSQSIEKNREKLYYSQLDEIKLNAEKWAYSNLDLLPTVEDEMITITLQNLKEGGFVALDIRDPRTNELLPNDLKITITFRNNNYEIEVLADSGTSTNNAFKEGAPTIILNGNVVEYVEINSIYIEKGTLAKNSAGELLKDVSIIYQKNGVEVGGIDTSDVATYTVTYSVSDGEYRSTITRTVVVRDTTPPVISLPNNNVLTSSELASFDLLAGVVVTDNSNRAIDIETRGYDQLPTDKVIEYKACDIYGNCTTQRRLIKVN